MACQFHHINVAKVLRHPRPLGIVSADEVDVDPGKRSRVHVTGSERHPPGATVGGSAAVGVNALSAQGTDAVHGFVAACSGNLDGTGLCINQETGSRYTCLISPDQVIDYKSRASRSFQCVWISSVQANYAEFW